ncbi:MAG: SGNH/GDSL hydrolase family protein [Rikenellaceae bacterium]|nr:SGNH/GDSL hydrolase family protein [Rikenellaceae bacterium]
MKLISALGDSIMRGVVLEEKPAAAPRYTLLDESFSTRCSEQLGLQIRNFGRYGNTTTRALRELDKQRDQLSEAEFCVLEFGGNDCDHPWQAIAENPEGEHRPVTPLAAFAAQYHELIRAVRNLGPKPIILSLPPIVADSYFNCFTRTMSDEHRANVLRWLDNSVENITRWHEMYNLELFKLASLLRVPIIDITTPFLSVRHYRSLFCDDGIHPNREGHRLIADTICNYAANYI